MITPVAKKALHIAGFLVLGLAASQAQVTINVNGPAGGQTITDAATTAFTFTVSGLGTQISAGGLQIRIAIGHNFDTDLAATLRSPSDTTITLFNGVGAGGTGQNFQDTLLSDSGAQRIGTENDTAPFNGTFKLQGTANLSSFNGQNPNGTWTLSLTDQSAGDQGVLWKAGDNSSSAPPSGTSGWGAVQGTALTVTAVPEPSTYAAIFGLGTLAFAMIRRRVMAA